MAKQGRATTTTFSSMINPLVVFLLVTQALARTTTPCCSTVESELSTQADTVSTLETRVDGLSDLLGKASSLETRFDRADHTNHAGRVLRLENTVYSLGARVGDLSFLPRRVSSLETRVDNLSGGSGGSGCSGTLTSIYSPPPRSPTITVGIDAVLTPPNADHAVLLGSVQELRVTLSATAPVNISQVKVLIDVYPRDYTVLTVINSTFVDSMGGALDASVVDVDAEALIFSSSRSSHLYLSGTQVYSIFVKMGGSVYYNYVFFAPSSIVSNPDATVSVDRGHPSTGIIVFAPLILEFVTTTVVRHRRLQTTVVGNTVPTILEVTNPNSIAVSNVDIIIAAAAGSTSTITALALGSPLPQGVTLNGSVISINTVAPSPPPLQIPLVLNVALGSLTLIATGNTASVTAATTTATTSFTVISEDETRAAADDVKQNLTISLQAIDTKVDNISTKLALQIQPGASIFASAPGLGCNGLDDDLVNGPDDCGEDKFPPFFANPDCLASLAKTWVSNTVDAKTILCDSLKPADDCTTQEQLRLEATRVPGTSCENAEYTFQATDRCNNTKSINVTLPTSTGAPNLTLSSAVTSFPKKGQGLQDIGLNISASEGCAKSPLTVKLTIWSDEGYAASYTNEDWRTTFARVGEDAEDRRLDVGGVGSDTVDDTVLGGAINRLSYRASESRSENGTLLGFDVYLQPQAFMILCKDAAKFKVICKSQVPGPPKQWSRNYIIDVTVTNAAGLTDFKSLTIPVIPVAVGRHLIDAAEAVTGGTPAASRELHPGSQNDGRRFILVQLEGVLGSI